MKRRNAAVLMVLMTWCATVGVVIEDGELGVTKNIGVIRDAPLPAGVAFVAPVVGQVEIWNVKLQELKEIAAKMEGFLRETLEPQGFAGSVQRTPFTVPLQ